MRQTKLLLLSFLSVLLCPLALKAQDGQTINNYTVDFNTSINTSDHNFIVAKGWKNIVGMARQEDSSEITFPEIPIQNKVVSNYKVTYPIVGTF